MNVGTGEAADTVPILVVDGDGLWLAHAPDDVRPLSVAALDMMEGAAAVLVRQVAVPRRQRIGAQSRAATLLATLPFYALVDSVSPADEADDRMRLLEGARTPFDRLVATKTSIAAGMDAEVVDLIAEHDDTAHLLSLAFEDLARRGTDESVGGAEASGSGADRHTARARVEAKWRFVDIKDALNRRLHRVLNARSASVGGLCVAHYRCGNGDLAFAMPPGTRYVGIDPAPTVRRPRPGHKILSLDAARGGLEAPDVVVLTGMDAATIAAEGETLAMLAEAAPHHAHFIAIVPLDSPRPGAATITHKALTAVGETVSRALGTPCEMRHVETLAHKPRDVVPASLLVNFEVTR